MKMKGAVRNGSFGGRRALIVILSMALMAALQGALAVHASGQGIITTVAGSGVQGFSGDGGPATVAALFFPTSVSVDSSGNIFIADRFNRRIRKVATSTGVITTVVGMTFNNYLSIEI